MEFQKIFKMKYISIFFLSVFFTNTYSQTKVAILDFENTSGITKYDGFGKALSNMLITDLKNSIHPRKVTFIERSQLNKILSEQNLQKSKNFDSKLQSNKSQVCSKSCVTNTSSSNLMIFYDFL